MRTRAYVSRTMDHGEHALGFRQEMLRKEVRTDDGKDH